MQKSSFYRASIELVKKTKTKIYIKNFPCLFTMANNILYMLLWQGFDGDTSLWDIVTSAMFSKAFPDVKSPEQMAFEMNMESFLNDDEIHLDDLSPAEFLTDSESEEDNDNVYEILEDMDFLGEVPKKRGRQDDAPKNKKRKMDEACTSSDTRQPEAEQSTAQEKKQSLKDTLGKMNVEDKKAIRVLFTSIKQMRKAAKLNLSTLTKIQNLIKEYPSLKFLYKLLKPITKIMLEQPINMVTPVVDLTGVVVTSGGTKYPTQPKTDIKLTPKKYLKLGKVMFHCSAEGCDFMKPSWGAVNTHIITLHTNKVYVC